MVIVAEIVCIIPSIPVAGCSGEDMTADGAYQELPEIQVGVYGLAQLRSLFPFAVQNVLNGIKGFFVNQRLVLCLHILSRFIALRRDVYNPDVELVSEHFEKRGLGDFGA
ncbi:MAG: hypothetical protein IJ654_00180 [Bacteroidales bacterium]|nr:hypothetical protein [Bacteroidales bacterium]